MNRRGERVLIVLMGAIGDVTRALPLLGRLRRGLPEAHVAWAIEPLAAPLLEDHPWLDERLLFYRPGGARAFVAFLREVRARGFTLAIDLQRSLKSGVVTVASGARERLGFARINSREGNWLFCTRHLPAQNHHSSKLRQFLAFGDMLGLPPAPVDFGFRLRPEEEERVEALLGPAAGEPLAAFFVGSSCPSRLWFPETTAEVLRALKARYGLRGVLLGGRGDMGFAAAVARAAQPAALDLTGRTTLRELIGVVARARLAVGPDSGPMHIAAAVGTPVISLWGATSPGRSAPYGSEAYVIAGSAPCAPCFRRRCPIGRACMRTITPQAVIDRAGAILGGRR